MKKPSYTLSIPQPCDERWDAMTPSEKGRFCGSCQKQVVDFSGLSDREVIQLIELSSGKVCGRLHPQQLNRPMVFEPWAQRASVRFSGFFAGLMLLSSAEFSNVQAEEAQTTTLSPFSQGPEASNQNFSFEGSQNQDSLKNVVKGKLLDAHTKVPMAQVEVTIRGMEKQNLSDYDVELAVAQAAAIAWAAEISNSYTETVTTDSGGTFFFNIPQDFVEKTLVITILFSGHTESRILEKRHFGNDLILTIDTLELEQWQKGYFLGKMIIVKETQSNSLKNKRESKRK